MDQTSTKGTSDQIPFSAIKLIGTTAHALSPPKLLSRIDVIRNTGATLSPLVKSWSKSTVVITTLPFTELWNRQLEAVMSLLLLLAEHKVALGLMTGPFSSLSMRLF